MAAALKRLIERGEAPVILDVRPPIHREREGWIPGALAISDISEVDADPQRDPVIDCACPSETSAAKRAQHSKARGCRRVRPGIRSHRRRKRRPSC